MIIEWVGDTRFTKYGEGKKGNLLNVPDDVGNSFINQGLAILKKEKRNQDKEQEK